MIARYTFPYHPAGDTSGGGLGDSNYRLKIIQHAIGNNAWPDFSYQYDKAGNITHLANSSTGINDNQTFTYDHLNRLLTAQATGNLANYNHTGRNNDYNYDQLGNITYLGNNTLYDYQNWSSSCPEPPTQEMPHAVKKIGNQYFCYDDNGNMTTRFDGTTLYDQNFNIENELTSVTANGQTTNFTYDANGIRVKTVQPNGTLIDTPFPDYEVENPGLPTQTVRITLTIAGQAVATRVATSSTSTYYYLFTDHLGSTVLMASQNSAKNQLEAVTGSRATYYPFGDYRGLPPTQTLTDRGFTGQKSNNQPGADLGLLYYNARYYAPGLGRFISADTIVPDPANPQAFNRYAYTLNNPVNFIDPAGHSCSNSHLSTEDQNACSPSSTPPPGVYNSSMQASAYLQDFLIASGIDQTTFDIPRHLNDSPSNSDLFRYEIGAWVLYQEQNGYHPLSYIGLDGPEQEYFSIRGIYTSTVLLQVIQSREQNYFLGGDLYHWIQEHPTSGQFGYPSDGNNVNTEILNDFLILSYLVEQGDLPDFLTSYPDTPTTANPSGRPIFFGHYDLVEGVGFYNGRESLSVSSWAWNVVDWTPSLNDFYGIVGWPHTYTPK